MKTRGESILSIIKLMQCIYGHLYIVISNVHYDMNISTYSICYTLLYISICFPYVETRWIINQICLHLALLRFISQTFNIIKDMVY